MRKRRFELDSRKSHIVAAFVLTAIYSAAVLFFMFG